MTDGDMSLDPMIAFAADFANAQICARMTAGATMAQALAELAEQDQLVTDATSCGHLPMASRAKAFRHATYSNGTREPRPRAKVTGPFTSRDGRMFYRVESALVVGTASTKAEAERLAKGVK